ncbi:MAG: hypothetical protein IPL08_14190 [Saprospiraceae bacterium]|nr:hypothetical protein [Saprospiraceae bacterium]
MKNHQTPSININLHLLQSQSITFGPTTTLFNLDGAHWALSQPMIPAASSDGKHIDFYGLKGARTKSIPTAGSYPATSFMLLVISIISPMSMTLTVMAKMMFLQMLIYIGAKAIMSMSVCLWAISATKWKAVSTMMGMSEKMCSLQKMILAQA